MNKDSFYILKPRTGRTLYEQADDLLEQLHEVCREGKHDLTTLLQVRIYVSDAANQCEALRAHELIKLLVPVGVCGFVEQPPLDGSKLAVSLWFLDEPVIRREVFRLPHGVMAEIHTEKQTYLYHTVRFDKEAENQTSGEQTRKAFELHIEQLEQRGLTLGEHCRRTWIYVRDVDRHYAGVVKARNEVFALHGLTSETHYIASTGIGGAGEWSEALVAMDFLSVSGLEAGKVGYLHAPEYLNPTHEYGVAFERGTYLDLPGNRCFLISGTASIDKYGACVHRGDVITQAGRLFLNIEQLLASGGGTLSDAGFFIVYLRDVSDRMAVDEYMRLRFPRVPYLLTEARVCRPEWLIEVECVAVKTSK